LHIEPWAPGEKSHWVRIVPASITGRRIQLPELRRDRKGYLLGSTQLLQEIHPLDEVAVAEEVFPDPLLGPGAEPSRLSR
jgi:hypothetical protein